jgi:UPF0716 protein FxsA
MAMRFLFLLFIIIPIIEITLLINVGQAIGAWYTVGLVLLSAFIGVNMLRYQGLSTLARAQQKINAGEMPAGEMIEGLVLAVGGALLITPGFFTDVIGFCCLIPFSRQLLAKALVSRFTLVAASHRRSAFEEPDIAPGPGRPRPDPRVGGKGETIDGEYRREDD